MLDLKIDHLMIAAGDWRAAKAAYERLGFIVSPLRKNKPMGGGGDAEAGSTLVMFDCDDPDTLNYLELSSVIPERAYPVMLPILDRPPGPAKIVHHTGDLEKVRQRWADGGIETPHYFEAKFPKTDTIEAAEFKIAIADLEVCPFYVNVVQSPDRSGYRDPALRGHPNGARQWTRVFAAYKSGAEDKLVDFVRKVYGREAYDAERGGVSTGAVELLLLDESRFKGIFGSPPNIPSDREAAVVGFEIAVRSLADTQAYLEKTGVNVSRIDYAVTGGHTSALMLGPDEGHGSVIVFTGVGHAGVGENGGGR